MFATAGLFNAIPCPYLPHCPRQAFCIYSHTHTAASDSPPPTTATAHVTKTPKRKLDEPLTSRHATQDKRQSTKPAEERSAATERQTPIAAMETAKRRKLQQDSFGLESRSTSASSIRSQPAVLLARPQANVKAPTTLAAVKQGVTGPPVLKIDLRAHSKPQFRQAVAMQYYNEFLRIYAPLGAPGSSLATAHAIDQEKAVHGKTNVGSYRSLASTVLQRLKKRPAAISDNDVGIDGVWVDPVLASESDSASGDIWEQASEYVQTLTELEANEYPVSVPVGIPPELDAVQVCDRCQKQYEIHEELSEEDSSACQFHDRRIRTKVQNGERVKYFPCCDAPQGGPGCREGPHVFKEDGLLCLQGRAPFIETPAASEPKGRHAVVAMDCEMCYTTGGFELARISVVGQDGRTIMDELVKPKNAIVDLNSRYSGIMSLEGAKYDLEQARAHFLELIDGETIVIGHSLENDFKVLRLIHTRVIDTAMSLARQHLHITIQDSEHGHDSFEDAKTCLDLVRLRIEKDNQSKVK
ncbi:RNA exonuclease 3 [Mortierella alpina]|uniref:RNA exonuclease 3 n=1 Tax=Mortierella alpina TaxID=64518 RepID=A0A9P6J6H4_MORAP|nr:RNA exonuclease 3 [Mortierella alpina]